MIAVAAWIQWRNRAVIVTTNNMTRRRIGQLQLIMIDAAGQSALQQAAPSVILLCVRRSINLYSDVSATAPLTAAQLAPDFVSGSFPFHNARTEFSRMRFRRFRIR